MIRKPHDLSERYGKNTWALVTGATGGIGFEYCKQLMEKGFNVIISGRNEQKLVEMQNELKEMYTSVETKILVADFSESLEEDFYMKLKDQLEGCDISVLVNNAGVADFGFFEKMPPKKLQDMIHTNVGSCTMMTKILIADMMKRNDKSAIINVSSIVSLSPVSYTGCYPATKVYIRFLSYILHEIYSAKIDVQNLVPGYVTTKMVGFKKGPDACTPKQCVKSSLKCLGYERELSPYIAHSISAFFVTMLWRFFPSVWEAMVSNGGFRQLALEGFKKKYDHYL